MVKIARISSKRLLKDADALAQESGQIQLLGKDLAVIDSRLSKRLAEELRDRIVDKYHTFINTDADELQNRNDSMVFVAQEDDGRYGVHVIGHEILYDEFGTGTLGEHHPHPKKSKYPLNPYNSGKMIEFDGEGNGYWFFKGEIDYGQPAGMFVYNALKELSSEKRKIGKEILSETIRKRRK